MAPENFFAVVRRAVLMEDEGRTHVVEYFETSEKAQAWIADQECAYFKPHDYFVAELRVAAGGPVTEPPPSPPRYNFVPYEYGLIDGDDWVGLKRLRRALRLRPCNCGEG